MMAGLEGRRRSGKGRGHQWETAAGDRPKCLEGRSSASRTGTQGDGRAGGRKRMCSHPRFSKTGGAAGDDY